MEKAALKGGENPTSRGVQVKMECLHCSSTLNSCRGRFTLGPPFNFTICSPGKWTGQSYHSHATHLETEDQRRQITCPRAQGGQSVPASGLESWNPAANLGLFQGQAHDPASSFRAFPASTQLQFNVLEGSEKSTVSLDPAASD